jgi:hypothetical protein
MAVPILITELSQTPAANSPSGSESPSSIDDYLRTYAGFIAQLRDNVGFAVTKANAGANTDITSLTALASVNGGPIGGLRNVIINGGFSINQVAYVSAAAVGANLYGHDMWRMAASGDTYTFSTSANVTTVTIPATKVLRQVVEGLSLVTGTYTLSWSGTAQGKIGAGVLSASGVTGSIVGGTDTTIEFGPGTVSNVQLEFGTVATAFERRPIGAELALCQRYLYAFHGGASGFCNGSLTIEVGVVFPVTMRAAPTLIAGSNLMTINWSGQSSVNPSSISLSLTGASSIGGADVRSSNYTGLTSGQGVVVVGSVGPYLLLSARL